MTTAISSQRNTTLIPKTLYLMLRNNFETIESQSSNFKTRKLTDSVNPLGGSLFKGYIGR
jgi:hypothetical protein